MHIVVSRDRGVSICGNTARCNVAAAFSGKAMLLGLGSVGDHLLLLLQCSQSASDHGDHLGTGQRHKSLGSWMRLTVLDSQLVVLVDF